MSTGNGSSMNPKPVPAWLNSAAWASKPRSPVRTSYSFGDKPSSGSLLEPIGKSTRDFDDPLSNIAKPRKEVVTPEEEIEAAAPVVESTQAQIFAHAPLKSMFLFLLCTTAFHDNPLLSLSSLIVDSRST